MTRRLFAPIFLILFALAPARADDGQFEIMADDGAVVANHQVTAELESQIEKLPGVIVAANPKGKVTIAEFYDLNCPYCRKASADLDVLVQANSELRLVLVPFPVLGIASIQGSRVELAVAKLVPGPKFYAFHRKLYAGRGMIDGNRALATAKEMGLDMTKVLALADQDAITQTMIAHVKLGDDLAIQATPGLVIKGVAIVGYPGKAAIQKIVASVQRCGAVVCEGAVR
ncbi:MAG: DsbA family protein [Pseudolabrys sp.]